MSVDTAFHTILWLMAAGVIVSLAFYSLWAYLHHTLPPKLDHHLFKEPYFNNQEKINYQFFPLSCLKSLNYIYLVAYPTLAKKRRFRKLDYRPNLSPVLTLLCKIQFTTGLVGLVLGVAFFVSLAVSVAVYT